MTPQPCPKAGLGNVEAVPQQIQLPPVDVKVEVRGCIGKSSHKVMSVSLDQE